MAHTGDGCLGKMWDEILSVFDSAVSNAGNAAGASVAFGRFMIRLPEAFASSCLAKTGEGITIMPDYVERPNATRSGREFADLDPAEKIGRIVLPINEEAAKISRKGGGQLFDKEGARAVVVAVGKWVTLACGAREFSFRAKHLKVVA